MSAEVTHSMSQRDFESAITTGIKKGVKLLMLEVQLKLNELLTKPGTGKLHPGNSYRSSAKGHPPASQTGRLLRSVQTKFKVNELENQTADGAASGTYISAMIPVSQNLADFGGMLDYAAILEDQNGLDRPFISPSIISVRKLASALMIREIKYAIKQKSKSQDKKVT
tara:strand:+ start:2499 stop:3002 length:504 start_codon:yes stop_codon:yes gene_type:complete